MIQQLSLFELPAIPTLQLTRQECQVFQLLQSGEHLTGADIVRRLNISDPNSVIRNLRSKGVFIGDYPHPANHRRKVFFLK